MIQVNIPKSERGKPLSRFLRERGYTVPMPCGGNGRCGNCKVRVTAGIFLDVKDGCTPLCPDENGMIPACRALCPAEGGAVALPAFNGAGITDFFGEKREPEQFCGGEGYGLALDIGTTTLALQLADLTTGACLEQISALNPQQAYGADVITRTDACRKGLLGEMQQCLLKKVGAMITQVCPEGEQSADTIPLVVVGNTVMLHIFLGVSPEGMATYPFTPAFTAMQHTTGSALGLPCGPITLLPAASAFIGADITAGLAACGVGDAFGNGGDTTLLFTDWGTNGETVLLAHGQLYGASVAAGPAMEGGNIRCGVGGVPGAVNAVFEDSEHRICFTTVADGEPVGFCTAGLVDWLSLLLKKGTVDKSGFLRLDPLPFAALHCTEGKVSGCGPTGLFLTGPDVREFQTAKSAIRAGIEALLAEANVTEDEVQRVYLAGGIGNYVNTESAVAVGLLPASWQGKTKSVGNSALAGAVQYLLHVGDKALCCAVAQGIKTAALNDSPLFEERFIHNMMF